MNKFDVILADPPWLYKREETGGSMNSGALSKYPVMSIEAIASMPIGKFAAENCALFIWVVSPKLYDGIDEIWKSWGFRYVTKAWTWVKANKSGFGFFTGMGHYTRANTEDCLLCIKGSMPVASHAIQALIYYPVREHSRKPDDQYRKIETLYPNARYLELFARRKRQGWASWGNEIDCDVDITASNSILQPTEDHGG